MLSRLTNALRSSSAKSSWATFGLALTLTTMLYGNRVVASEQTNASTLKPRVMLVTSMGDIILELDHKLAPRTVDNFLAYIEDGFYDGTIFHRVMEGFMIQGGGFTADYDRKDTKPPIKNEANNGLSNRRYSIAMARTNAPHSATAQFFINTVDNDFLDHTDASARGWGYAVFGKVVKGKSVVDEISQTPTAAGGPFSSDAPTEKVVLESVKLLVTKTEAAIAKNDAGKSTEAETTTKTE